MVDTLPVVILISNSESLNNHLVASLAGHATIYHATNAIQAIRLIDELGPEEDVKTIILDKNVILYPDTKDPTEDPKNNVIYEEAAISWETDEKGLWIAQKLLAMGFSVPQFILISTQKEPTKGFIKPSNITHILETKQTLELVETLGEMFPHVSGARRTRRSSEGEMRQF